MPASYPPLFQDHAEEVGTLLKEIHEGKLALPEFQRSFIWPARNTARLISSLTARYPAGALLTWRPGDHGLAERPVEGAPPIPPGLPYRLILDGQQRLTSLYRALYGVGESRFNVDLNRFINRNTLQPTAPDEVDWDKAVIAYEPSAKQRRANKDTGELPDFEKDDWLLARWEFPVNRLMIPGGFDMWLDELVDLLPAGLDKAQCKQQMRQIRDSYLNQLATYDFPVITLTNEASLRAVCSIFENLNTNNVRLGVFEILTARFYPKDVDLRELWKVAKTKYKVLRDPSADKDPDGFAVDPYMVIQIISARVHRSPQQKVIVDKLEADEVSNTWEMAVSALREVIEHLRDSCGIIHRELLPYTMVLVPMAVGWIERSEMQGPAQGAALQKLERYFWSSVFTLNFDQGGASQAEKDCADLLGWLHDKQDDATGVAIVPEAVGLLEISAQTLVTATVRKRALFRAIMALTIRAGARDFHNGQPLVPHAYVERKYDSHHIFPKRRLTDNDHVTGIDPHGHSAELILNRALIDAGTNGRILAKRPSQYIDDIQQEGVDLQAVLASHLISPDVLETDDYDAFLRDRLDRVVAQITDLTEKTVVPLPEDAVPGGDEPDEEVSEDSAGL